MPLDTDSISKLNDIVYGKAIASTLKRVVFGKTTRHFRYIVIILKKCYNSIKL